MTEISTRLAQIDLNSFTDADRRYVKHLLDHKVHSSHISKAEVCDATGLTPDSLSRINDGLMPIVLDHTDKVWVLYKDENGEWKVEDRRHYLPGFDDPALVYLWYNDAVKAIEEKTCLVANWKSWR